MLFAQILGKINTVVFLSVVYIVVIGCMAFIVKLLRKDLLQKKINNGEESYWQTRDTKEHTLDRCKFQF
jgi:hypothetical protein